MNVYDSEKMAALLQPHGYRLHDKQDAADLIILNTQGIVAESISSNLFWVKEDVFYTPSLESGCLNGVMRKQIIKSLNNQNKELKEGMFSIEELKNAESIFCTNVTGITQFKNFNDLDLEKIELENLFKLF